jgi:hypothetical protein
LPRKKEFWLDDFSLVKIQSFASVNSFYFPLSWTLDFGAKTLRDLSCDHCLGGYFLLGGGYTFDLWSDRLSVVSLAEGEILGSPRFMGRKVSVSPGARLNLLMHLSHTFHFQFSSIYHYRLFLNAPHSYSVKAEMRYAVSQDFAFGLVVEKFRRDLDGGMNVFFYF